MAFHLHGNNKDNSSCMWLDRTQICKENKKKASVMLMFTSLLCSFITRRGVGYLYLFVCLFFKGYGMGVAFKNFSLNVFGNKYPTTDNREVSNIKIFGQFLKIEQSKNFCPMLSSFSACCFMHICPIRVATWLCRGQANELEKVNHGWKINNLLANGQDNRCYLKDKMDLRANLQVLSISSLHVCFWCTLETQVL